MFLNLFDNSNYFGKIEYVVFKCFEFGPVKKICRLVNGMNEWIVF